MLDNPFVDNMNFMVSFTTQIVASASPTTLSGIELSAYRARLQMVWWLRRYVMDKTNIPLKIKLVTLILLTATQTYEALWWYISLESVWGKGSIPLKGQTIPTFWPWPWRKKPKNITWLPIYWSTNDVQTYQVSLSQKVAWFRSYGQTILTIQTSCHSVIIHQHKKVLGEGSTVQKRQTISTFWPWPWIQKPKNFTWLPIYWSTNDV